MSKTRCDADRRARSDAKKKSAGLMRANIWVHPDEVEAVREYANRKPLTRAILTELGLRK